VGKRVPQSPEQSFVLRVRFADPDIIDAMLQGRYVGQRFEDDINTLPIDHLAVADVVLSRQLTPALGLFLGVENLFDQRYEVLRDTAGLVLVERRTAHIGVRFGFAERR
jgi:iron complex outermembrane receptor protein